MTRPDLRVVARRRLHSGWNTLDEVDIDVTGTDGAVRQHVREIIDHGHGVAVLPVDRKRRVALLVRQWRAPLIGSGDDPFLLEACAGLIDAGETAEQAMHREAEEELGIRLDDLQACGRIILSPGCLTETISLFIATYDESSRVSHGGGLDHEGEEIEIVEIPLKDVFDLAGSGALLDAKTVILIQMLMLSDSIGAKRGPGR